MRTLIVLLVGATTAFADVPKKPAPTSPDEPVAKAFSAAKAGEYLDGVSLAWTRKRQVLRLPHQRLRRDGPHQDRRRRRRGRQGDAHVPRRQRGEWDKNPPKQDYVVLATAFTPSAHDAATTGKLHRSTKAALDRSFAEQLENGSWDWPKCNWPPLEHDDYYGVPFVMLAIATAPDGYAKTDIAKKTLAKAADYLKKNPPPDLHHRAMLAWTSTKIDGLMTDDERKAVAKDLLAKQRKDGGWCLPSLGDYKKRRDGKPVDPDAPSDGYGTGYAAFVLRQLGVPATDPALVKAVAWLKENQRESGRWYTRSLRTDGPHLITNAGSAFCVLALAACDVPLDR